MNVSSLVGQKVTIEAADESAESWFGFGVPRQVSRLARCVEVLASIFDSLPSDDFALEITASAPEPQTMQLFYLKDGEKNLSQNSSVTIPLNSTVPRVYRFPLTPGNYTGFRFDPMMSGGQFSVRDARLIELQSHEVHAVLPFDKWRAGPGIQMSAILGETLAITVTAGHNDPMFFIDLPGNGTNLRSSLLRRMLTTVLICVGGLGLMACLYKLLQPTGLFQRRSAMSKQSVSPSRSGPGH